LNGSNGINYKVANKSAGTGLINFYFNYEKLTNYIFTYYSFNQFG